MQTSLTGPAPTSVRPPIHGEEGEADVTRPRSPRRRAAATSTYPSLRTALPTIEIACDAFFPTPRTQDLRAALGAALSAAGRAPSPPVTVALRAAIQLLDAAPHLPAGAERDALAIARDALAAFAAEQATSR